jgi:hypothetical protein
VAGAILMRVLNGPKTWLIHATTQGLGILFFLVGTAIGIYLATTTDQVSIPTEHSSSNTDRHRQLDSAHAIIGLLLFAMVWLVAVGGFLQHLAFRKHQRRTGIGYVHMWVARALITLAFVNGGLGLQLADQSTGGLAAYGVVAAIVWLAWVAITFLWSTKRKRMDT